MKLYEIIVEYRTVVCAESKKDALSSAGHIIRHQCDEPPVSVEAEKITTLFDLPPYWKGSYIPWGENEEDLTTREILDNAEN